MNEDLRGGLRVDDERWVKDKIQKPKERGGKSRTTITHIQTRLTIALSH